MLKTPAAQRSLADLEDELMALSGHLNAGEYRLLELIYELDLRGDWFGPGLKSLAHWLNWRIGLALGAAREKVRVAKALPALPLLSSAFRAGEVSYSKVRAMTRIATPDNEALLLEYARHGTASHMERMVRVLRHVSDEQAAEHARKQRERRALEHYFDSDGMLHVHAVLPPEEGMVFMSALEQAAESIRRECEETELPHETQDVSAETRDVVEDGGEIRGKDLGKDADKKPVAGSGSTVCEGQHRTHDSGLDDSGPHESASNVSSSRADNPGASSPVSSNPGSNSPLPKAVRWQAAYADAASPQGALQADALVRLSTGNTGQVRPEVIVHTDAGALRKAHFHGGPGVGSETARRLACDAMVRGLVKGAGEQPLTLGRRQRVVSKPMRRMLEVRDGGCRYPGCTQRHRLHAHHIQHWADGGETALDNMLLLCNYHHHLVHEGGHHIERCTGGELRFTDHNATPVPFVLDQLTETRMGVDGLERAVAGRGIAITPRTAECLWDGAPLDINFAPVSFAPVNFGPVNFGPVNFGTGGVASSVAED